MLSLDSQIKDVLNSKLQSNLLGLTVSSCMKNSRMKSNYVMGFPLQPHMVFSA